MDIVLEEDPWYTVLSRLRGISNAHNVVVLLVGTQRSNLSGVCNSVDLELDSRSCKCRLLLHFPLNYTPVSVIYEHTGSAFLCRIVSEAGVRVYDEYSVIGADVAMSPKY